MRRKGKIRFAGLLTAIIAGTLVAAGLSDHTVAAAEQTPAVTESPAVQTPEPVRVLEEITVQNSPLEAVYGTEFPLAQVTLLARYSDGSTQKVNPEKVLSFDMKKLGTQKVQFSYQGKMVDHTITVVPGKVNAVTMKEGTPTSMRVVWEEREEAESYEIYTASAKDGKYTFVASTKKAEYTFQNMVQGRIIYIRIRAVAGELSGEDSAETAIAAKPEKVPDLKIQKSESTAITVKWQGAQGATGYAVYYRLAGKTAYTYAGSTENLKYRVKGLKVNKEYDLMVRAYAADISNESRDSEKVTYGTAPAVPVMTSLKGGDKRLKIYWKKSTGAEVYRIYVSKKADSGFTLKGQIKSDSVRIFPIDNLAQNQMYYVKMEASREYNGDTLTATSIELFAATRKAKATSTSAKNYKTTAKFKKSLAYKNYKEFRKQAALGSSYVTPGLKTTNVGGMNTTHMVPQSVAFVENYLLISAYDLSGEQESVIYIMDKKKKSYITTLVLPHQGHVGGMAYDGDNIWISYGRKIQCIKKQVVLDAAKSGKVYTEIYTFTTEAAMPDTASYVTYYKDRVWVGAYSETAQKYMYGYSIANKTGVPVLTQKNKILMPNRTQGVTMASDGRMIISRSCQTRPSNRGFLCQLDVYKPTWKLSKKSVKKNKRKKVIQMPPMNEGIVVNGTHTYLIFESSSFTECSAPVDRVMAFSTGKLIK